MPRRPEAVLDGDVLPVVLRRPVHEPTCLTNLAFSAKENAVLRAESLPFQILAIKAQHLRVEIVRFAVDTAL